MSRQLDEQNLASCNAFQRSGCGQVKHCSRFVCSVWIQRTTESTLVGSEHASMAYLFAGCLRKQLEKAD